MGKAKRVAKTAAKADRTLTHRATQEHDGAILRAAGAATEVADQPPLIALSAATIVVGAVLRRPAIVRSGVRMLASHIIATGVKSVLKSAIDRTRPERAVRDGHRLTKGSGSDDTSLNSFPSGHTAGAVAVAQAIAADHPLAGLPAQAAAAGVASLQPRRGKHYWSDVIAGAAIGWVAERATRVAIRAAEAGWDAGRRRFTSRGG